MILIISVKKALSNDLALLELINHQMMAEFDIVHFGVTGFTGKLVLRHFLIKNYDAKLAVCARNIGKAQELVNGTAEKCNASDRKPPVLEADLVCNSKEDEEKLRAVVKRAEDH